MIIATSRLWGVRYALPAIKGDTGERRYSRNGTCTCICETIDEAISLLRQKHPDALIWSVNHRGQDETYFQQGHLVLLSDTSPEEPKP